MPTIGKRPVLIQSVALHRMICAAERQCLEARPRVPTHRIQPIAICKDSAVSDCYRAQILIKANLREDITEVRVAHEADKPQKFTASQMRGTLYHNITGVAVIHRLIVQNSWPPSCAIFLAGHSG